MPLPQGTSQRVRVSDDLTLHYEEAGTGNRVILFVPGWTMSTAVFSEQLSFFADSAEYRFLTYDPRGQGLSTKSAAGHFYEQHGRDLNGLIEALELDKIVLGGWSAAGLTVLSYIHQFGADRLSGLILIDAAPRWKGADNSTEWVNYRYDDADGAEEHFTMGPLRDREKLNREIACWMLEDPSPESIAWIRDISNHTSDTVAALLNATGGFLDYRAELMRLEGRIPFLYVVREDLGDIVANWAKNYTPGAGVAAFGKHLMFRDRAEEFNSILYEYLKKLE
ncbi:MAG: alpha/beta fold hydrolase [bacterium]